MPVQGERIAGGFILITGLDGIRYACDRSRWGSSTTPTSAATKPSCSFTADSRPGAVSAR